LKNDGGKTICFCLTSLSSHSSEQTQLIKNRRVKGLFTCAVWWSDFKVQCKCTGIAYFFEYNAHTSILHTLISQWFLEKKIFLVFKNNFKRNNHCKFIHHKSYLKPFLSYLPCIVHREYFSIIFNVKKSAHYTGQNLVMAIFYLGLSVVAQW